MIPIKGQKRGLSGTVQPYRSEGSEGYAPGTGGGLRTGNRAKGLRGLTAFIAAALLSAAALSSGVQAAQPPPFDITKRTIEEKAPDFVLTDLKGQKFRLSDHRGKKPVLIIFSTTWCSFCKAEIPHFKSLYTTYTKQGLEVVNIDIQESKEKVARFTAQHQLPYRVLLDEDGIVSGIYDVRGVPTMILVDKNGMIVCRQCRTVDTLLETMMKKK